MRIVQRGQHLANDLKQILSNVEYSGAIQKRFKMLWPCPRCIFVQFENAGFSMINHISK